MKTVVLLVAALALTSAIDVSGFQALVQTGTRAFDAVESVYNMLRDLKTENLNVQVAADRKNETDESDGARTISEFTTVVNLNRVNFKNAQAFRENIEKQISDAVHYIDWANARLAEIDRRTTELGEERCYSNGLFVRSLKDHSDAKAVVKLLKHDISGITVDQPSSFTEVHASNVADKLSMYSHLFQKEAMKQFLQLTSEGRSSSSKAETVAEQVLEILSNLENQLDETLAFLQQQEIESAFALSKWISDISAETAHIRQEIDRTTSSLDKLNIAHPAALQSQAKANSVLGESINALNGAIADLEEKRADYAAGTERRAEENAIIDECIHIFKDQVRSLVDSTSLNKI